MNQHDRRLQEVHIAPRPIERFEGLVDVGVVAALQQHARELREQLGGHAVWNVNSTAVGGGVAEMLGPLLAYSRGAGIDARWLVATGDPAFFAVTKRIHHALHGSAGDGSPLGERERRVYEHTLALNAADLEARVRPDDVVVLHDPQTLGLASVARGLGARVVWRSHIGCDRANGEVDLGWDFLRPYLRDVEAAIFSRPEYAPPQLEGLLVAAIAPSLDPFSAKNQKMGSQAVRAILAHTGLLAGPPPPGAEPVFVREDGSPGRVERRADIIQLGPPVPVEAPLVVQVSRWDPLKDHEGVMHAFARSLGRHPSPDAELLLVGPNVHGVADDPEAPTVFERTERSWRALPHAHRQRVHLAMLPMADLEENAAIVNALQRHAAIVVQKSLQEGFGLTVAEAMWKGRAVVASAVGGIVDQIEDGRSGVLLDDPRDLDACGRAIEGLLADPARAAQLGAAARERVCERFLATRHLAEYAELFLRPVVAA
jgi:trehalose synthase